MNNLVNIASSSGRLPGTTATQQHPSVPLTRRRDLVLQWLPGVFRGIEDVGNLVPYVTAFWLVVGEGLG